MSEPNKVIYNGDTLIDLTSDTVTPDKLAAGVTAHDKSGASIVGTAYKNSYYVKGTQTASTNVWTGDLSEVDALYDGLAIDYWLPFAGTSSAATLNLTLKGGTKTGAIPVYRDGANTFTNNVGSNQIIRLIYHSVTISGTVRTGWRIIRTQDSNDAANRIYNGNAAYQANSAVYRYQLLFQVDENKLTPLNNVNNSTATNKTMLTGVDFLPFGKIFYYNSTTNVTANGNMTSALNNRAHFDLRYSLNSGTTLTANRDIYLKCVKQSNGKFRITADPCWTQSLPSTADGYYYLRLGRAYSTSNMYLDEDHPIYYHDGTALRFYTDPAKAVSFAALTGNPTDNSALNTALAGKVNTSNALITGPFSIIKNNNPAITFFESDDTTFLDASSRGNIYIHNSQFYFSEYYNKYAERYLLPDPDSELTESKFYNILTSKTPVTTGQGGTGGIDSGWKNLTNASVFSGVILYRKVGVFLTVTGQNIFLANELAKNSYVELGELPNDYYPYVNIICACMTYTSIGGIKTFPLRVTSNGKIYLYTNNDVAITTTAALMFSGLGFSF